MFKATIYHWHIEELSDGRYVVYGWITETPHLDTAIRTSWIELLNLNDGWVKTRNSFYKLEQQRII